MRKMLALASAGMLLFVGTDACAAPTSFETPVTPFSALPALNSEVTTPDGPAFVIGNMGSMGVVSVPGAAGQGFLMNNGNGTSTLLMPDGPAETVAMPR